MIVICKAIISCIETLNAYLYLYNIILQLHVVGRKLGRGGEGASIHNVIEYLNKWKYMDLAKTENY